MWEELLETFLTVNYAILLGMMFVFLIFGVAFENIRLLKGALACVTILMTIAKVMMIIKLFSGDHPPRVIKNNSKRVILFSSMFTYLALMIRKLDNNPQ